MSENRFDYGRMIAEALRNVARQALAQVAEEGLPGEHHFYLTFRPRDAGVVVPTFLRDQYSEEMTVVLQNQFWDLLVDDEGFSVTLAFAGSRQRIMVPWPSLTAFADPTAQLGLRFVPETPGGGADEDGETEAEGRAASRWGSASRAGRDVQGDVQGDAQGDLQDDAPVGGEEGEEGEEGAAGDDGEADGPAEEAAEEAGDNVVRLDRFRRRDDDGRDD